MKTQPNLGEPLLRLLVSISRDPSKTAVRRLKNIRKILKECLRRARRRPGVTDFPGILDETRRRAAEEDAHLFPETWGRMAAPDSRRVRIVKAPDGATAGFVTPEGEAFRPPDPGVIRELLTERKDWDVPATSSAASAVPDDDMDGDDLLFMAPSGIHDSGAGVAAPTEPNELA